MIDRVELNRGYRIAIGSDHAGVDLKRGLILALMDRSPSYLVEDLGPHDASSVDYPDYAGLVCRAVLDGRADRGILICGSGIGMSIAANRHHGIRCALVHDVTGARLSRQHNNSNVISLGARMLDLDQAWNCVLAWICTPYEGGRHDRRLAKMDATQP